MNFDRLLDAPYGQEIRLSPLVSRILAPNPGPFTFKGTGTYLVGAGAQLAVVDPGPALPEHVAALKRAIGERQVRHILITHTHRDHSPAAAPLKQWSGAKTYALAPAGPAAAGEGAADEAHDHDFVPDVMVTDGVTIAGDGFDIACVATPGHTANHLCYALAQEKALFSGDHVMGWSTSVIAPPDGDMGQYLASLEKLAARDERIFYPTHGSPIPQPRAWLAQLIAHRRRREAQILEALAQTPVTIVMLAEQLYPDIEASLRAAAALQIKAHLEHLRQRGLVAQAAGQWIRSETG
ncbi:MAG: MBL fold metallo-hydrolase [Alphaproteobacteria bacterium]|nr:MBL fold metallo-hydrolase [Alphaproteobacteria bacterium]